MLAQLPPCGRTTACQPSSPRVLLTGGCAGVGRALDFLRRTGRVLAQVRVAGRCEIARLWKLLPPGRSSPFFLLNSHPSDRPRVRSKRGEAVPLTVRTDPRILEGKEKGGAVPCGRAKSRSAIGIGGSLTAPPLPHHRAYGSVHGGSTESSGIEPQPRGVRVRRAPCGLRSLGCRGCGLHPPPAPRPVTGCSAAWSA